MSQKQLPIYLYSPNIVGYFRLLFLFVGLYLIKEYPIYWAICFVSNLILDALDGQLARMFDQTSAFGAILDYTTDRISFASYAILLAMVYPSWMLLFCICLNLDLASHFFHLKSSYALNKVSHKEMAKDEPLILRWYYQKLVLGVTCLTHDLFFIFLYLYAIYPSIGLQIFLWFTVVGVLFKVSVHVTQIACASRNLLAIKKIL